MVAPFIPTVNGTIVNPSILRDINPALNDTTRLIPQIIGNNPAEIRLLASKICDLGYRSINLNMGCPHSPVTRKKRGSGLLPYPDMIKSILDHLPFENCSFSVKLRLGLESENDIEKIIPILNEYPLQEIIIHPRTGIQMYTGSVNLEVFQKCLTLSEKTVVYNGDIFSCEDFGYKSSRCPQINRWMLGRGVLCNPFLLQTLRNTQSVYNISNLRKFHDEILDLSSQLLCGPSHLLGKMKGLWTYMADCFNNGKQILKKIQKTSSMNAYNRLIDLLFEKQIL